MQEREQDNIRGLDFASRQSSLRLRRVQDVNDHGYSVLSCDLQYHTSPRVGCRAVPVRLQFLVC